MPLKNDFAVAQKPAPGALLKAMRDGSRIEAIEDLLRRGANVDECGGVDGLTSLMLAVWRGDEKLTRLMLKYNADVNINKSGITAMMWAASGGHLNLARLLIGKVADINEKSCDNGTTSLMWAAVNGHAEIVEFLISKGAAVNEPDYRGNTALMGAAVNGHAGSVLILLDHGADVMLTNLAGDTAQDCALRREHRDVALILQEAAEAVQRRSDELERVHEQHIISSGKQEWMKHRARNLPKPGGLTCQN